MLTMREDLRSSLSVLGRFLTRMKRVPEHDERYNALEQTRRQLKQEFSDEFARLQQRESIEYRNNVLRMLDYN